MKNVKSILLASLAILSLSCSKESIKEEVKPSTPQVNLVPMTFSAASPLTKTAVAENGKSVNWLANDAISVIDDYQGDPIKFDLTDGAGTSSAKFSGEVPENATEFYAFYPYVEKFSCIDGYFSDLEIFADQSSTASNISAGMMVAKADESNNFAFKNVNALVKFAVKAEDNISKVAIRGVGKENIAGALEFTYSDGAVEVDATKLTATEVSVSAVSGSVLSGTYYLAVAPVELSGIEVQMWNSSDDDATLKGSAITLKSGDMLNLGTLAPSFQSEDFSGTYVLAVKKDGVYYAMSSEAYKSSATNTTTRRDQVEFDYANPYVGDDVLIVWNIEKAENGYYLSTNDGEYASYSSNALPVGTKKTVFNIEKEDDVYHILFNDGTDERQLALNSNGGKTIGFGMYKYSTVSESTTYVSDFCFIPCSTLPSLDAARNVKAAVDDSVPNKVDVSWDAVENAGSYEVTFSWGTNTLVKSSATNSLSVDDLKYSTEYSVSVVAIPANAAAYRKSKASDVVKVTTGVNPAGEETVTYTLTFPDDNNADNTVGSYSTSWTAKAGTNSWTITNFNNNNWKDWTYIKAGPKSSTTTASIATAFSIPESITTISVTIDAISNGSVEYIELSSASKSDFSDSSVIEKKTSVAKGDVKFIIGAPSVDRYYKLTLSCKNTTKKTNGVVQISKVIYTNAE